jgi:hypothetical protein
VRTFVAVRALAAEAPVEATVRGGSMAPLLKDGDRVAIARARLYLPGDVVAFRAGDGRIVVHRLLGYRLHRGRLACVARGDAAAVSDPPFPLDLVLGRVSRVVSHPGPAPLVSLAARFAAVALYLRLAARRLLRVPPAAAGR